jgi:hypothetical protein
MPSVLYNANHLYSRKLNDLTQSMKEITFQFSQFLPANEAIKNLVPTMKRQKITKGLITWSDFSQVGTQPGLKILMITWAFSILFRLGKFRVR